MRAGLAAVGEVMSTMEAVEPPLPSPPAIRPEPTSPTARRRFTRGKANPRGVVWFGVTSFWGHLRHFVSAAIATEDIDSRDWMTPDVPAELVGRVARVLGGDETAGSVVEAIGRDLWLDYISDTGDDVSVSRAVARLVVGRYELPDPQRPGEYLVAPRGELLVFGGDTAYPVATAQEIQNRVLVPFNEALAATDAKQRVLLGIPGNHDWYDGLDGFGRMFRRRFEDEDEPRPSMLGVSKPMLEYYAEWAREFLRGGKVEKPKALVLSGYVPVQNASYFLLPLTPRLHLYGVDRQLKSIDSRQKHFFAEWARDHGDASPWVLLPDPLFRFGGPSPTGTDMIQTLGFDFHARAHFILSGDVHHYERSSDGNMLHVIAGGGGAFLHPAPVVGGRRKAERRWPNAQESRALLGGVPWKIARGRSGFLPHLIYAALFAPAMSVGVRLYDKTGVIFAAPIAVTLVTTLIYSLIGGARRRWRRVLPAAFTAGLVTASLPICASLLVKHALLRLHFVPTLWVVASATLVLTVFTASYVFGFYLAWLTRRGIEHTQAFTALDHPGYKHFLRLRVRADGSAVDGFCIGLTDPLAPDAKPELVDTFTWRPGS
ncbi:MAG TPA: hypothetical protein VHB79_29320 [Polyangiaceae bacterium]|nr:hypothetical protein [Polyangiaceae bacterium]